MTDPDIEMVRVALFVCHHEHLAPDHDELVYTDCLAAACGTWCSRCEAIAALSRLESTLEELEAPCPHPSCDGLGVDDLWFCFNCRRIVSHVTEGMLTRTYEPTYEELCRALDTGSQSCVGCKGRGWNTNYRGEGNTMSAFNVPCDKCAGTGLTSLDQEEEG